MQTSDDDEREDITQHEGFFTYGHQRDVTCYATSALGARVARLGPRMDRLTCFRGSKE